MKFSKIEAGYISNCKRFLIEKTDYAEKDSAWRLSDKETGESDLSGTKRECVALAQLVSNGECEL